MLTKTKNWDQYLPTVLWSYRIKTQESLRKSPYELLFWKKYVRSTLIGHFCEIIGNSRLKKLKETRREAQDNLKVSQNKCKTFGDFNLRKMMEFGVGDLVRLRNSEGDNTKRIYKKWLGPYFVDSALPKNAYKLKDFNGEILKQPVNVSRLAPFHSFEDVFISFKLENRTLSPIRSSSEPARKGVKVKIRFTIFTSLHASLLLA